MNDTSPGLGRIDDIVDFEVGGDVERFAVFVCSFNHRGVCGFPRSRILNGIELAPEAQSDCAFESHPTQLPGGPGHGEDGLAEAPSSHGLCPQPVTLAQDHGTKGYGEVGSGYEHPAHVANQCGLLGLGPDHESRRIAQEEQRQVEPLAELHEACSLVGAVGIDGPGEMEGIVGEDSDRAALDPDEADTMPGENPDRSSSTDPVSASSSSTLCTS